MSRVLGGLRVKIQLNSRMQIGVDVVLCCLAQCLYGFVFLGVRKCVRYVKLTGFCFCPPLHRYQHVLYGTS